MEITLLLQDLGAVDNLMRGVSSLPSASPRQSSENPTSLLLLLLLPHLIIKILLNYLWTKKTSLKLSSAVDKDLVAYSAKDSHFEEIESTLSHLILK